MLFTVNASWQLAPATQVADSASQTRWSPQSSSLLHVSRHAPSRHANGSHRRGFAGSQPPCPPQARSQQTPSAQCPLAHARASSHGSPSGRSPAQVPASHQPPASQSESPVQARVQASPSPWQRPGAQLWFEPGTQAPAPSHALAGVSTPFEHAGAEQAVPAR
jgi:hypothetical protein